MQSDLCKRIHSVERSLFYTNSVNPIQQSDGSLSVPEDLSKTQLVKSPFSFSGRALGFNCFKWFI